MVISKQNIFLEMDEQAGFIKHLQYEQNEYIGGKVPLFVLAFRNEKGEQSRISTFDMALKSERSDPNTLKCTYEKDGLRVETTVLFDTELSWHIDVHGINEQTVLEWVNYPQISVCDNFKDNGGNSKILWGFNEGTLVDDMTVREKCMPYFEPEYPCQGMMAVFPAVVETQFMAYYDDVSGMYLASHDRDNHLKGIDLIREGGGAKLEFRHFTGCSFGQSYKMPYPMVVSFFKGDWYDAAEIYRTWFESDIQEGFVPITENKKLPDWYEESPVIVTYPVRGVHDMDVGMAPNKLFPYINVMPHIERLEKAFDSKIMVLLMHWEGTAPWAPPIVWPPYGGEEKLKELIEALHARGDVIGVYCSGLSWTLHSNVTDYSGEAEYNAQNVKEDVCLPPDQREAKSNICQGQRVSLDLCPTRDFTIKTISEQVGFMVDSGLDYIQLMDQNHGGTSFFCYSQKHNHPPVPGKWQVDAVKHLLKKSKENAGKVLFGCESAAAESYIPELLFSDNRFNIAYKVGKPVPCYAYVYHEYVNNFMGNQVCTDYWVDYDKSPDAVFERLGYAFSAGDMLTVVLTQAGEIDWHWGKADKSRPLPNQSALEILIKNLNFWRMGAGKKYLHTGKMLKPMKTECEINRIWRVPRTDCFSGYAEVPVIHTSRWMAPDGSKAQFLINYNADAKVCIINVEAKRCVLNDGAIEKTLQKGKNEIVVPAYSAVMIEEK